MSFRRNLKESYDFDKLKNFPLIAQIAQIFFMIKLSRVFVIPKEYKRKYDFDKIKNLSLIAQIAQIFNTESTENSQRTQRLDFMFIVP